MSKLERSDAGDGAGLDREQRPAASPRSPLGGVGSTDGDRQRHADPDPSGAFDGSQAARDVGREAS